MISFVQSLFRTAKVRRWLAVGAAIWLLASLAGPGAVRAAAPENKLILNAKGVTLPFYSGPENKLSLLVKVDRFTRENQRKGFFRIGVLPLMVAHEVKLDVRQPEHFSAVVQEFHRYLAGKDLKKGVELRGFTLTVPTNGPTLTATKVRILSPAEWELSGVVRLVDRTSTNEFSKASLTVSGKDAGRLRASSGPAHSLFETNKP